MKNNKIAFVLEGAHHLVYIPGILKNYGKDYPVTGYYKNNPELIDNVNKMIRQGTRVIITSGGYYETLVEKTDIPLVKVTRKWADITTAIRDAKKKAGKTAILARQGVFLSASLEYKMKFDDDVRIESFDTDEECHEKLELLKKEGYSRLICGSRGANIASAYDFEIVSVPFEDSDIMHAVTEAERILSYMEAIERTGSMMKTIQNSVTTAIVATDPHHRITEINNAALNALAQKRSNLYGVKLESTELSGIADLENYRTGSASSGELVNINGKLMSVSLIPVSGNDPMTVITFSPAEKGARQQNGKKAAASTKGHQAAYHFEDIIGRSESICSAKRQADRFARVDSSILISAPTGCGKEMFAQSIHNSSRRRNMPFVVVNCAALPESLLESTLFGYEKGAFTGAAKEGRQGLFLMADGGTVFLDEISEMPLSLQSRFLRVLQEKEIMPVGSDRVIPVDVRVLAATNRNLYEMAEQGSFRQDLYFRLAVLELKIPALSERIRDIPLLVKHFLYSLSQKMALPCPEIDDDALAYMMTRSFPGNVRQLENTVERLLVLHEGGAPINTDEVRDAIGDRRDDTVSSPVNADDNLDGMMYRHVTDALEQTKGNRKKAADLLQISTTTLWRYMKKYGLIS